MTVGSTCILKSCETFEIASVNVQEVDTAKHAKKLSRVGAQTNAVETASATMVSVCVRRSFGVPTVRFRCQTV